MIRFTPFLRFSFSCSFILVMGAFSLFPQLQDQINLLLFPEKTPIQTGETTLVKVQSSDAENLFAYEIQLSFDPTIVEVMDADPSTPGIQALPGSVFSPNSGLIVINSVDNDKGEIILIHTLLGTASSANSTGTLVEFSVRAKSGGDAALRPIKVALSDRNGNILPHEFQSVALEVNSLATSPAATQQTLQPTIPRPPGTATNPATLTATQAGLSPAASPSVSQPAITETPSPALAITLPGSNLLPTSTTSAVETSLETPGEPTPPGNQTLRESGMPGTGALPERVLLNEDLASPDQVLVEGEEPALPGSRFPGWAITVIVILVLGNVVLWTFVLITRRRERGLG